MLVWIPDSFSLLCPRQHRGGTSNNVSLPGEAGLVDKLRNFLPVSFVCHVSDSQQHPFSLETGSCGLKQLLVRGMGELESQTELPLPNRP